eukprot:TRINITY_DN24708_c2_g1_i2.p1 TRINITY_DN24708_c2_g1~~TRINITY_DN24708_c2_g1_i2.p1  ORF type:complete len:519 (-),score=34.02 TRINITY_DN24708_c2_g1_i2:18-1397(-)
MDYDEIPVKLNYQKIIDICNKQLQITSNNVELLQQLLSEQEQYEQSSYWETKEIVRQAIVDAFRVQFSQIEPNERIRILNFLMGINPQDVKVLLVQFAQELQWQMDLLDDNNFFNFVSILKDNDELDRPNLKFVISQNLRKRIKASLSINTPQLFRVVRQISSNQFYNPQLLQDLSTHLQNSEDVSSNILYQIQSVSLYSLIGHYDQPFFDSVIEHMMVQKNNLKLNQFLNTFVAMVRIDHLCYSLSNGQDIVDFFITEIQNKEREIYGLQQCAQLFWCSSMAKIQKQEWWSFLDKKLQQFCLPNKVEDKSLPQLLRAYRLYQEFNLGNQLQHTESLISRMQMQPIIWQNAVRKDSTFSQFQEELEFILEELGVQFEQEVEIADGLAVVDFVIKQDGKQKLIIEADGPSHFCQNVPKRPLRKTMIRDEMLKKRGWKVLAISLKGWMKMHGCQRLTKDGV